MPLPPALRDAAAPGLTLLAPGPDALAAADPATLGLPRARAAALVGLAGALARGEAAPEDPVSLLTLPGIGPWTAQYVALRAGDRDAFPATDLGLRHAARGVDLAATAERWRPLRGYGAHHLWNALAERGAASASPAVRGGDAPA